MSVTIQPFNDEQKNIIRRKYNEYKRYYDYTAEQMLEDSVLKNFIYSIEVELGSKSFDMELNSNEDKLFTLLIEPDEYSNELVTIFKDTLKSFQ